ncbi:MAG: hypothetical protein QNJ98_17335 [Planctomycetota bacterium]|nr:hypothetical protein [Planctomycetota bacterium]
MSYATIRIVILLLAALPLVLGLWCLVGPARSQGRAGLRLPGLAGALGVFALVLFAYDLSRGLAVGPLLLALVLVAVPIVACAWRPKIAIAIAVAWIASAVGLVWGRYEVYVGPRFDVVEASEALEDDGRARVYVASGRGTSMLVPLLATQRAKHTYDVGIIVPLPAAGPLNVRAESLRVLVDGQALSDAAFRAELGWETTDGDGVVRRPERARADDEATVRVQLPRVGSRIEITFDLTIEVNGVAQTAPVSVLLQGQRVSRLEWVPARL